jgi:hypothetical protein
VGQVDGSPSGTAAGRDGRPHCLNGDLARMLVSRLKGRGLDPRLVTYPGDPGEDERVEQIVIVNPAARERGEVRVGDDGSVVWEYFGSLDEAGVSSILDEVTNALRATGVRLTTGPPVMSTAGAIGMPGSGHEADVELSGTDQQQLVFLNTHYAEAGVKPRNRGLGRLGGLC